MAQTKAGPAAHSAQTSTTATVTEMPTTAASSPVTPAGPRGARSATSTQPAAPSGPASSTRSNGAGALDTRNVPTGPSNSPASPAMPSQRPAESSQSSMGPPTNSLSIEEERAAARARKFGMISKPLPPVAPASPAIQVKHEHTPSAEVSRPRSPALEVRRDSPAPSRQSKRSGSVESRVSERVGRDQRDRGDRERTGRQREDRPRAAASRTNGNGRLVRFASTALVLEPRQTEGLPTLRLSGGNRRIYFKRAMIRSPPRTVNRRLAGLHGKAIDGKRRRRGRRGKLESARKIGIAKGRSEVVKTVACRSGSGMTR